MEIVRLEWAKAQSAQEKTLRFIAAAGVLAQFLRPFAPEDDLGIFLRCQFAKERLVIRPAGKLAQRGELAPKVIATLWIAGEQFLNRGELLDEASVVARQGPARVQREAVRCVEPRHFLEVTLRRVALVGVQRPTEPVV